MRKKLSQLLSFFLRQRDGWPLSVHIAFLTVAIMLPLLFLAGLTISGHIETTREALYQDAQKIADGVAVNLEREVASVMTLLNLLAQDPAFDRQEYQSLYTRAKEGLKQRKGYVVLFGEGAKAIFSTRFDFGAPLPDPPRDGAAEEVMRTGLPLVSNIFFGRAAQQQIFAAIAPIVRSGKVVGRLHLALAPADLTEAISPGGIAAGWSYSIADRNLAYVVSSDPERYATAERVKQDVVSRLTAESGQFRVEMAAGDPLLVAYRKSALIGWTAFAVTPLAFAEQPLMRLWRNFVLAGSTLLAISLLAAYALARVVAQPIQSLARAAAAFGEGQEMPMPRSALREANLLSSAFSDAAAQLRGRSTALLESERRFRLFAGRIYDVIWFADLDKGRFDYVSPAFEAISGRSPREVVTLEHWRNIVYPDDLTIFERRCTGDAKESVPSEYRIIRPNGEVRWVQDTRFPLEESAGKPRVVAGILRDITARRAALHALKAAQAEA
jgi:PAS domain S-box-containing protein